MAPGSRQHPTFGHRHATWIGLLVIATGATLACREQPVPTKPAPSAASASAAPPSSPAAAARPSVKAVESDEPPETPPAASGSSEAASGGFLLGPLEDLGPSGPATAGPDGVVMVTRRDALAVARWREGRPPGKPGSAPVLNALELGAADCFPYAVGPAVANSTAYWVSEGRLLSARLDAPEKTETLATDARSGARVSARSAPNQPGKTAVAYVAQATDGLVAKLWVKGSPPLRLSPSGTAANSVSLAQSGSQLVAISLEGRSGMSPIHARTIDLSGGAPKLGEDVVVWVAGTTGQLTEVLAAATPGGDVFGLLPVERDISHFGLARLHLSLPPTMNTDVSWRAYPNGLDPAPVAAAEICKGLAVGYARPADASPRAPQELHLAQLDDGGLGQSDVVARASAFTNVSLGVFPGGALLSWVADRRTWARTLFCAPASPG